jgi:hypothetical protein
MALNMMNVPLTLVVLGLVAGLATAEDRLLMTTVTLIALPIVGTALTNIPTIGAQLNAVALNLQLAMAGALATAIAIRLYHLTMDGVTGLAGASTAGTAAAAAR